MKALIKVGYGCNDHCSFCHTQDVRHVEGDAAEIERKIDRARALGHTMVVLSGGEPTIRPELLRWAARVAAHGMDFGLVTNGRMLSYPELVDRLLRHRLRYVYLSLHGGTARVHDLMVRSHAFEQTYGALDNLAGRGLDLCINCVVTRHNMEHLRGVIDACLRYDDATVKLSLVEPKGGGAHLFRGLVPDVAEAASRARDALRYAYERAGEGATTPLGRPRFVHGGFPLCLMEGFEHLWDDLKSHRYWTMVEVGEPDFFPVDDDNKVQPEETCRGCRLRGPCPGLYRVYHRERGHGALVARRDAPRSNSFNYRFERVLARDAPPDHCPLRDGSAGVTPWDRGRHLVVRRGGRIAVFRATSRDFSDVEMRGVKHETGQLYLDATDKDAPDDFGRDLVKLERSALCAGCPERARCTGLFEPVEVDVFGRDDALVGERVRALAGDVLDVGCGEGRYGDALGAAVAAGRIRYVGLDPDARAVESLAARWPWAELAVGRAEAPPVDGPFDHALVLRSWNHLEDPEAAAAALVARLRPGGTLLVVDNVAFGLARTPRQAERAERSSAAHEHYRNDDARDAHEVLAARGLELLERRDVGPDTSNQWLLRYRRP